LQERVEGDEGAAVEGVERWGMIREFARSLLHATDTDGKPCITSTLIAKSSRDWDTSALAPEKCHAINRYLDRYPVPLPEHFQTRTARFLYRIRKLPSNPSLRFLYRQNGDSAAEPRLAIAGLEDYNMERLVEWISSRNKVERAWLLGRGGSSIMRVCESLFNVGAHVEICLQNPQMPFLPADVKRDIRAFSTKIAQQWDRFKRGSLRIYTSISVASMRAVKIDADLIAAGWLPYSRSPNPSSRARTRLPNIKANIEYMPYVLIERGHDNFEIMEMFFNHCFSLAREGSPTPAIARGVLSEQPVVRDVMSR
jgi:hypothetical protein